MFKPRLRAVGVGVVLLALRQRLIVVVHGARRPMGFCEAVVNDLFARDLILRLRDARLERLYRRQELRLIEILCYAHGGLLSRTFR